MVSPDREKQGARNAFDPSEETRRATVFNELCNRLSCVGISNREVVHRVYSNFKQRLNGQGAPLDDLKVLETLVGHIDRLPFNYWGPYFDRLSKTPR